MALMALDDKDILDRYNESMGVSCDGWDVQHSEMYIDRLFYDGKYNALLQSGYLDDDMVLVNINEIKPVMDKVTGFLRQIRRPISLSSLANDEKSIMQAEIMNNGIKRLRNDANLEYAQSDQDKWCVCLGIGFLDNSVDLINNISGTVRSRWVNEKYIRFDTNAEQRNLEDGNFITHTKLFPLRDALTLFPENDRSDFLTFSDLRGETNLNNSPVKYTPQSAILGTNEDVRGDLVAIDQFYFRYLSNVYVYENPLPQLVQANNVEYATYLAGALSKLRDLMQSDSGDGSYYAPIELSSPTLEIDPKYKDNMDQILAFLGEPQSKKRQCYKYHTALVGNQKVLKHFPSISQNGFQIQAKTGYRDEETGTWYGLIRQMREPSSYINKIRTDMMYILEHASKNAVLYNEDAVEDAQEFEDMRAEHGATIGVNDISGITTLQSPNHTGYESLYSVMQSAPAQAIGMNQEWLGTSQNRQVSAAFESQRISQVTSVLSEPVDSISLGDKQTTRQYIDYMRYLVRLGEKFASSFDDDGESVEVLLTNAITDVDYQLDMNEIPLTATMRQLTAEIFRGMAQEIAATTGNLAGYGVALDAMAKAGVDTTLVNKMKGIIQPPEPTPEQQEMERMQLEERMQLAELEKQNKASIITERQAKADKYRAETQNEIISTEILQEKPLSEVNASA